MDYMLGLFGWLYERTYHSRWPSPLNSAGGWVRKSMGVVMSVEAVVGRFEILDMSPGMFRAMPVVQEG